MSSNKLIYDTMNDIYKNTLEQLKFSETKNNILTTIIITITVLYIRYYYFIKNDIEFSLLYKSIFFFMFVILLISIVNILKSFYPNLDNSENEKLNTETDSNIYFFKNIALHNKEKYLDLISDKTKINDYENREQLLDLSNQIITLSKITIYKLEKFKSTIRIMSLFFLTFVIFYSMIFWC